MHKTDDCGKGRRKGRCWEHWRILGREGEIRGVIWNPGKKKGDGGVKVSVK